MSMGQCSKSTHAVSRLFLLNSGTTNANETIVDIYHITQMCPHTYSVLGGVNTGDYVPEGQVVYFNRSDVTKALNAVPGTNWDICTDRVCSYPFSN